MLRLKIQGMTCGHCVGHVKSALEQVPGVASATVNLAQGEAEVIGTPDLQALIDAVSDEGYTAAPLS